MIDEGKQMSDAKKNKIGNWLAVMVVILSIFLGIGFKVGSDFMFWCLAITNIVFGPACFFFYLREVRKGVFATSKDEG